MAPIPVEDRYEKMIYRRCGRSGLKLPAISLGLWHNFGGVDVLENGRAMVRRAFDLGITHFDLANNYGPPPGSAEENFGRILEQDLRPYRDELIISTKAGYDMWPGPYGEWGSRKYLVASLDQSLKRMGLEYVDIFYSPPPRPRNAAGRNHGRAGLRRAQRDGRCMPASPTTTPSRPARRRQILRELGTPCLIHQPVYNMFNRWIEDGLLDVLDEEGIGCIPFSPLAQGLLTDRYLKTSRPIPRAAKPHGFLKREQVTEERIDKVRQLNELAQERGQTLAQMAIAWVLRHPVVTSALIGASRPEQIDDVAAATKNLAFSQDELKQIDEILV